MPCCQESRIHELEDLVGAIAGSDLPLQVVHAEGSVRAVDGNGRRPILLRQSGYQRNPHLSGDVVSGIVGGAEDLGLEELVPAATQLIDQRRSEGMGPGAHEILRPAQVVALVVAPERDAGFVSVIEDVTTRQCVRAGEDMIDATVVVVLFRDGAGGSAGEVLGPYLGVGKRHELEKSQRLTTQPRCGNDIVRDPDVERVVQRNRGPGARIG